MALALNDKRLTKELVGALRHLVAADSVLDEVSVQALRDAYEYLDVRGALDGDGDLGNDWVLVDLYLTFRDSLNASSSHHSRCSEEAHRKRVDLVVLTAKLINR